LKGKKKLTIESVEREIIEGDLVKERFEFGEEVFDMFWIATSFRFASFLAMMS
jgi:hypothetical protein